MSSTLHQDAYITFFKKVYKSKSFGNYLYIYIFLDSRCSPHIPGMAEGTYCYCVPFLLRLTFPICDEM